MTQLTSSLNPVIFVQILIGLLRVNGTITWHWAVVLIPILSFLVGYSIFCLYFLTLLCTELRDHKGDKEYFELNHLQSRP